jgi:hypothetical protein
MRKYSRAGGAVLGLALLLLCACGSGSGSGSGTNSADGPFGPSGGGPGAVCAWTTVGGVVFYGAEEFPNSGGTSTIEKVSLIAAHNLRIVTGWAVPITGTDILGVSRGYQPIPGQVAPGIQWSERQKLNGAVIPRSRGQDVTNVVLILKASGARGFARAVEVHYKSGGTNYTLRWPIAVEVFVGHECPANWSKTFHG